MSDFVLENGESRLVLSEKNGALLAFRHRGGDLLAEAERTFVLRFLQRDGEYCYLNDSDFASFRFENGRGVWTDCRIFPGMSVSLEIRCAEEEGFRFRPSVSGIPDGLLPDYIEAPRVCVPLEHELFYPFSEGMIVREKEKRERGLRHLKFPDDCGTGYYPGVCQMQFMASCSENGGIYFTADDPAHTTKILEYSLDAPGRVGLRIETACGTENPSNSCTLPFELILRPFEGDWRAACGIYREWVKRDPAMTRKFTLPEWLEDSPVTIIYPVRGTGAISDEPNRFLPYENAFPRLKELSDAFGSRIMALLMRWDHNGPWLPPYYWPPAGGAESFRNLRDLLHESGNLLGVYGSGTFYTMRSSVNSYSGAERYQKEGLAECMARGPNGEKTAVICEQIRQSETFCISEAKSREILAEQVRILAAEGVDYAQFFDQNLGCASFVCYRKDHHHPPVPGAWQTAAMRRFLDELNEQIRQSGSSMILGAECAAAGPYTAALPFNDLRDIFCIGRGDPVPGYQYVFHRSANNFFGNQCEAWSRIDCLKSPDNLQYRLAKAFCAGEMLSVTLRDSGEIDWGAASDWSCPAPPQEPLLTLIRNLNAARRRYREFLLHGEMTVPPLSLECGTYTLHCRTRTAVYPSVPTSAWRSEDGRTMQFFVNFLAEPQTCRIDGEALTIPPLDVLAKVCL